MCVREPEHDKWYNVRDPLNMTELKALINVLIHKLLVSEGLEGPEIRTFVCVCLYICVCVCVFDSLA